LYVENVNGLGIVQSPQWKFLGKAIPDRERFRHSTHIVCENRMMI